MFDWQDIRGVLLDLDGTLFRGDIVLPGAIALIEQLRHAQIPFLYWTNNSTRTPEQVVTHLQGLGFNASENEVYTSSLAVADALAGVLPHASAVYALGEEGLVDALRRRSFRVLTEGGRDEPVAAVAVGLDREVTYARFAQAMQHLMSPDVLFYATNQDRALPHGDHFLPGAGAGISFLETCTARRAVVVGKPQATFVLAACDRLAVAPRHTLIVGDNAETDVAAAKRAGAMAVWVTTGVSHVRAERGTRTISALTELLPVFGTRK
ncbi:HAD-IIA family hydrolase [Ferroacidibacillus organovorans]|uniref:HAD-IIA family hydrolase n=1 Tax=Ferroacidibacillus organovorans TaxID=1765683 RepID=UPI0015C4D74C|nr:HAD-IIA family hydrolase [Ferroacidibacillus organovorans]